MRERTCCFTGHRNIAPEQQEMVAKRLYHVVEQLVRSGYCYFGAGGALGFDTMAARCVLKLREKYPQVKLILVLPCMSQTKGWAAADMAIYEEIRRRADKIVYTSYEYFSGCMFKRNRHLVECSSVCVAYLREKRGGTAYTVNYARQLGLKIINLAEY